MARLRKQIGADAFARQEVIALLDTDDAWARYHLTAVRKPLRRIHSSMSPYILVKGHHELEPEDLLPAGLVRHDWLRSVFAYERSGGWLEPQPLRRGLPWLFDGPSWRRPCGRRNGVAVQFDALDLKVRWISSMTGT